MEGLAKSAPVSVPATVSIRSESPAISSFMFNDTPIEVYDYFDVNYNEAEDKDKRQLKDIFNMLKSESGDMAGVFKKLTDVSIKLGVPAFNETKHGKIWSYLKISSQINELQKRQDLLRDSRYGR